MAVIVVLEDAAVCVVLSNEGQFIVPFLEGKINQISFVLYLYIVSKLKWVVTVTQRSVIIGTVTYNILY